MMTSVTTAAGLGSFAAAEMAPIADIGRYAAGGVMIAMLYSLVPLPLCWPGSPCGKRRLGRAGAPLRFWTAC